MNKTIIKRILISLLWFVGLSAYAQHTVVVNPDGTHSIIVNNGNVSTIVNPDGTHTTAINSGNITTIVNPNGTHSTAIKNGDNTTVVNPDGTHSIVIKNGNSMTVVNPDGTHTTAIMNANYPSVTNLEWINLWQTLKSIGKKKSSQKQDRKHLETDNRGSLTDTTLE